MHLNLFHPVNIQSVVEAKVCQFRINLRIKPIGFQDRCFEVIQILCPTFYVWAFFLFVTGLGGGRGSPVLEHNTDHFNRCCSFPPNFQNEIVTIEPISFNNTLRIGFSLTGSVSRLSAKLPGSMSSDMPPAMFIGEFPS
jgi:hypothetical protein